MENKSAYVNAHEVSQLLGVSQSKAYQIIKKMNEMIPYMRTTETNTNKSN